MTKREFFENELRMKPSDIGTAVPFNPKGETEVTDAWLISFIKNLLAERRNWHTGTPTEEGDYLVAFRMSDNSVEYGWCNWNNGAWDILCDYDTTDGSCGMIAWQKIEPCNWFDFLFSEGHCDNWREVRYRRTRWKY